MDSTTPQNNPQPSANGTPPKVSDGVHLKTPQPGREGVHLDTPPNCLAGSPPGLSGTIRTIKDSHRTIKDLQGGATPPRALSFLSLPFDEFLIRAYEANQEHLDTIEDGNAWQLQTPLFRFTHLIWSRQDLGADAHQPATLFSKIERALKQWTATRKRSKQEPPNGFSGDCWEEWFGLSRDECKTEFLSLWPKFRRPAGQSPLEAAVTLAYRMLLLPGQEVIQRRAIETDYTGRARPEGYLLFLSVCGHLQAMNGDKPIFLPQEELAPLLHVQGRTISRWRQWAVEDGSLRQVAAPGRRRAAEYRFNIAGYDCLKSKAPQGTAEGFTK